MHVGFGDARAKSARSLDESRQTYVFDFCDICFFDQTLVKKESVVVNDVDCVLWARSGSRSSCELLVFRRVLVDCLACTDRK